MSTDLAIIRARAKQARDKKKKEREELQKNFDELKEAIDKADSYSPNRLREMQKEMDVVMEKISQLKEEIKSLDEQIALDIADSPTIQGKPGKDGEDGYTPIKGKDYFDGEDGRPGKDGKSPSAFSVARTLKRDTEFQKKVKGKDGKDGRPGKDGQEISPTEVRDKLSTLRGRARLDAKHIKNINDQIDLRITGVAAGGGISDGKVKVDAEDTADYLENQLEAGSNVSITKTDGKLSIASVAEGTGDVTGPASATDNNIVTFDGTTGKIIQDGGKTIAEIEAEIPTDTGDLTNGAGFITSGDIPAIPDSLDDLSGTLDDIDDGATYVKSTNDFTDAEQTKLSGIEEGAEVNVNADWDSVGGDSQILNKPTLATVATSGSYDDLDDKPTIPTSHTELTDIGTNTHAQIDTHIGDSTIHFTEGSIDHTAISNIGTNTHAQIDTHISSTSNPHSVDKTDVGLSNVDNVQQMPLSYLDTDNTLSADSDSKVASQKATKAYVDGRVASSVNYKGGYDADTNTPDLDTSPSGISIGDMYTVTVAGTFFTQAVEVGDVLISEQDGPTLLSHWTIVNKDLDAASIKTAYESNSNTNAFTDADESKLDGIEAGAEVNTVDSVNTQTGAVVLDADDISDTTTTNKFTTASDISKLAGIEAGADVTDTTNVTAAGALMDSEVDADIKTFSLPADTTISTFGASLVDDADASTARTTLDVDQAGTDNSTDVTLAGSLDYLSIDGQEITQNAVDLTTDVSGVLPDANVADDITLTNITQITNRSHTNLSDVGTNTHAQIDTHIASTSNPHSVNASDVGNGTAQWNADKIQDVTVDDTDIGDGKVLQYNATSGNLEYETLGGGGTVTSVAVSGTDGIEVDSGSPITSSGTIQLGVNKTTMLSTLNVEDGAEANVVDSVNTQTGAVVLDADDIDDSGTTNKFTTASDISKLSAIEENADVTDATNVEAAGAVMESDTTTASMGFVIDEDNMASDLDTKIPTQQSVKAYVDSQVATANELSELTDVTIDTPADNEILAYDDTSGDWINQTPTEAGFSTVATSNSYTDLDDKPTIPTALSDLSGDADDIDDSTSTNKFVTATDITNLGNLSGTNTGDQSAGDFAHNGLASKQGGTTDEYYHLTAAEHTVVGNTSGTNTGDQSAGDFNHDDLANITGTPGEYNHPTDAQMTVLGNTSGTNTGDQTSIVGITGTKAQFDTACTDGDFLYDGDITQYTDENAQDAVGTILADSSEIDFTYTDATPEITATLKSGSIDETKLDTSVNASLDLADSAIQSGDLATVATTGAYSDLTGTPTIPDTEAIQDIAGAMTTGNTETNITVTYQDADGTIDYVVPNSSSTAKGVVELATTTETTTGTDATRAVTPDGLHDMTSLAGAAWFLDQDDMSSDSATQVASQQSIKKYVDDNTLDVTENADGFDITGGTTSRT